MTPTQEEVAYTFEGFSAPEKSYRAAKGRLVPVIIFAAMAVLVATVAGAGGISMLNKPEQINKPLLAAVMAGLVLMGYGYAVHLLVRVVRSWGQRVLRYPEGIVIWLKGRPHAYLWGEIVSVECHRKDVPPQYGLYRLMLVGKDLEYAFHMRRGDTVTLNSTLRDMAELGGYVERVVKERNDDATRRPPTGEPA